MPRYDLILRGIRDCVERAHAGEAPLETLVTRLLFGRDPVDAEPPWPRPGWAVWSAAVSLYRTRAEQLSRVPYSTDNKPSRRMVWAILPSEHWPKLPFTWLQMAQRLQINPRSAHYYLSQQGWRFSGRAGGRRVSQAPCVWCGDPVDAASLRPTKLGRICPDCHSLSTSANAA